MRPSAMRSVSRLVLVGRRVCGIAVLVLLLVSPLSAAPTIAPDALTFENADIRDVIRQIGRLTGTTFLFDPDRVKGRITILPLESASPAQALELLRSALALHGYRMLPTAEGTRIVSDGDVVPDGFTVKVVPLSYARAEDVAYTLAWIAPPGVRIVPYLPTNSVIIAGIPAAVEELAGVITPRAPER